MHPPDPDISPQQHTITEVLVEPGRPQLWVTFEHRYTHRIDLLPLASNEAHAALNLRRLFKRVSIGPGASYLSWPGGACLDARSILDAPYGPLPLGRIAVLPAEQRYRPLLPFLQHLQPAPFLRPLPIESGTVERLFQLEKGELEVIVQSLNVPPAVTLARLHDLGVFLALHFAAENLYGLMHRPWLFAQQQCPGQAFLHTMLGCLRHGRPDLIERPCLVLLAGSSA